MLQTSKSYKFIRCRLHYDLLKKWFSDNSQNQNDNNNSRPIYIPEEPVCIFFNLLNIIKYLLILTFSSLIFQVSIDNPPTTCCMSGCPNCVYIAWAEALSKKMSSSDPKIAKKVLESVDDPSMRAFLQMELRTLGLL